MTTATKSLKFQANWIDACIRKGYSLEEYKTLKILTGTDFGGKLMLLVFRGKAGQPIANFSYRTEDGRERGIKYLKEAEDSRIQRKEERRKARANFVPDVSEGDIFYASWGYDQTNVDFYQVIEQVAPKTVRLRKIAQETEPTNYLSGTTTAIKDEFIGDSFVRRILPGNEIRIDDVRYGVKWDGRSKHCSWGR